MKIEDVIKQPEGRKIEYKESLPFLFELKKYPDIELRWSEPGLSFRITFIKRNVKVESSVDDYGRLRTITNDSEQLRPIAPDYGRLRPITTDYGRLSYEEREILKFLSKKGKIVRKEIMALLKIGKTKAKDILSQMLEKGLIERVGKGRSTYYILKVNNEN